LTVRHKKSSRRAEAAAFAQPQPCEAQNRAQNDQAAKVVPEMRQEGRRRHALSAAPDLNRGLSDRGPSVPPQPHRRFNVLPRASLHD
jgi:hypothetical protein